MKGKVLFVVPEFDDKTPRTIRIENIVRSFKKDDYLIAKFKLNNSEDNQFPLIKPSWLARIYYRYRIHGIFRRLDSNFMDNLTPFIGIITRNILSLVKQNNISTVVIVSAPFSLFNLSKLIRKEFPNLLNHWNKQIVLLRLLVSVVILILT